GPRVVEFWKNFLDAKIVFPIPQDMEKYELNGLESYSTIEGSHIYLNKGMITDSNGRLYNNGDITDTQLPSKLMDNFGGILCLPDGAFFLGDECEYGSKLLIRNCYLQLLELIEKNREPGSPAVTGCAITGTPGIGKTYFGLYLLFYIRYKYPKATIIWRGDEDICYQFLPDGNVQEGDFSLFRKTLEISDNFYISDAHTMTRCKAYKFLLTSPKAERFNEAVKWRGFTKYFMPVWELEEITALWTLLYKSEAFTFELLGNLLEKWGPIPRSVLLKWDDVTYQKDYDNLVDKANLEKCINSIDKEGMPSDTASGRLVHLDVDPTFTKAVCRFASPMISNKIIQDYETKTRKSVRDFIMSSYNYPSGIAKGWPKSKTFASIDSFSFDNDNNTLDLYQITVSKNHGIKIKGLNDLKFSLPWIDVNKINLYFVVPSDIFESFSPQKYKTAKGEDYQRIPEWIDKIPQYALELNFDSGQKRSRDMILEDKECGEASEINVGSEQYNLKRSSNMMLVDNESDGEVSEEEMDRKDVKKLKT
ncbi:1130_t:CDS:2, partial [Diversispora eburnea]